MVIVYGRQRRALHLNVAGLSSSHSRAHHKGAVLPFPMRTGVHYFLIEAHVNSKDTLWSDELCTASRPGLQEFLASKGAVAVHSNFVRSIKTRGRAMLPNALTGRFSSRKIFRLLRQQHAFLYEQCGIAVTLCRLNVALDATGDDESPRVFLWVELTDLCDDA